MRASPTRKGPWMQNMEALTLTGGEQDWTHDSMLVRAAQKDAAAFEDLYQRYRHRVYAYLRARTPSGEDAEDLTQQVFVQALAALPRYHDRGSGFAPWLFRIARNAATNFQTRGSRPTVAWEQLPAAHHPPATHDLERDVVYDEDVEHLQRLLVTLSSEAREILALRFAGHLTTAEIAALIGKSEAATKKQLSRTLHSLKERYHERP